MTPRALALGLILTAFAAPALSQDYGPAEAPPVSAGSWSFAVGAGTDNRSKEASKSDGDAYVWGVAEWATGDGRFYVAPAFETIRASNGSDLEIEASVGWRPQFGGFDWDFNAAHKWQVDANPGTDDDAWEFTVDMERSIGPASARVQLQHSPDGTGSTEAWTWVSLRGGWDLTNAINVSAEVGRREQDNAIDYTGGNIGLSYYWSNGIELDVRYHATDANTPGEQYADRLVAGISYSF